ncbi:hypothetical protein B0J13DRAFT_547484 [Dactylonectria estremocensis]|uniref:Uncharacterized protein n=1 Tax=Dactylonectria estremocensis TaxID=1079267 RepID=A0A9P9F2P2_9HYPO|nr:hypothetical protein B0J13DRAFT_547484 [Dactylonectria estremocensis]
MHKSILIATLVAQGLYDPKISHVKWTDFINVTGIDEKVLHSLTDSKDEAFACTYNLPKRLDCAGAISAWDDMANNNSYVHVEDGQCITAENKRCRTAVCAPWGDLKVHVNEIVGRMWNPLMMKCVLGGKGGILSGGDLDFVIEVRDSMPPYAYVDLSEKQAAIDEYTNRDKGY